MADAQFEQVLLGILNQDKASSSARPPLLIPFILNTVFCSSQTIRTMAEQHVVALFANPNQAVAQLCQGMLLPTEAAAEMSGVILRKKLDRGVWQVVDGGVKAQLQAGLVQIVRTEGSMKIRGAAVEVIQRVSELILESTQQLVWDEMYQVAVQLAQAETAQSKIIGLKLFSNTCYYRPEEASFIQGWMQLTNAAMHTSHGGNLEIRIAASDAAKSLICWAYDGKSDKYQLSQLVSSVITFAAECCRPENLRTNDEAIMYALQDLEELTAQAPILFRPHLAALLQLIQVVNSSCDEESTKVTASEVAITLCEMKPNMIKKHPNFAATLLGMFSQHIITGTEEDTPQTIQKWNATLSTEEDDEDEMVSTAKQMMDRHAHWEASIFFPLFFTLNLFPLSSLMATGRSATPLYSSCRR